MASTSAKKSPDRAPYRSGDPALKFLDNAEAALKTLRSQKHPWQAERGIESIANCLLNIDSALVFYPKMLNSEQRPRVAAARTALRESIYAWQFWTLAPNIYQAARIDTSSMGITDVMVAQMAQRWFKENVVDRLGWIEGHWSGTSHLGNHHACSGLLKALTVVDQNVAYLETSPHTTVEMRQDLQELKKRVCTLKLPAEQAAIARSQKKGSKSGQAGRKSQAAIIPPKVPKGMGHLMDLTR